MTTGVQFEDDTLQRPTDSHQPSVLYAHFQKSNDTPRIVRLILKTKIIKTEQQAQIVILIVLGLLFCLMIFFFYQSHADSEIIKLKFK